MILVILGTQKFQFNRLLKMIDDLLDEKTIKEEVIAQIGNSDYCPKNFSYVKFFSHEDFIKKINECDIVITHGGVGSISNALRFHKKTIVVPRNSKYNEHVDNHQYELTKKYSELGYILSATDYEELKKWLNDISDFELKFKNNNKKSKVKEEILNFINN